MRWLPNWVTTILRFHCKLMAVQKASQHSLISDLRPWMLPQNMRTVYAQGHQCQWLEHAGADEAIVIAMWTWRNWATLLLSLCNHLMSPPQILQVIISGLLWPPQFRQDKWELWLAEKSSALADIDCFESWPTLLATSSNCELNSIWCGLQHSWHFWLEVHVHIVAWNNQTAGNWNKSGATSPGSYALLLWWQNYRLPSHLQSVFPTPYDMQVISTLAT